MVRLHNLVNSITIARRCVHCCKGDTASQWGNGNFGVSEFRNPWTDWLKVWLRDYVDDLTSYAKFPKIRLGGGLPTIWWTIHLAYISLFFLAQAIPRSPLQKKT